jgi:glucose-6-phosphate dehydrogenase assembly protein OpcA
MTDAAVPISPSKLLKELDALWLNLGHSQEEDPTQAAAVLRACAMTLIAVVEGDGQDLGETLALLVRDHPSRLIVINVKDSPEASLKAGVTAQCWMPFGKRQQICCEQIVIEASKASLIEIPPVIRGLIVPDLPVACWVRNRALLDSDLSGVIELSNKLIVDSGGVPDLAHQIDFIRKNEAGPRRVGDLAWTRLTRWRQAIAQLFDQADGFSRAQLLTGVRIEYQGDFVPMSAYYLVAWLRHCLGRTLTFEFLHAGPSDRARVQSVVLSGVGEDLSITVSTGRDVEMQTGARCAHTIFPRLREDELLREELSVLGPDPVYEAVIALVPELLLNKTKK